MALDINALFDSNYYLSNNPDVAQAFAAGQIKNPFDHYITFGKFENRAPGVFFDPNFYLEYYPDVKSAVSTGQTTAIDHFINSGQYEGRDPITEFDTSYYHVRGAYRDISRINSDPNNKDILTNFEHFIKYGQYQPGDMNLQPNANFDGGSYLNANPDVSAAVQAQPRVDNPFEASLNLNPELRAKIKAQTQTQLLSAFQHYLKYGLKEGRSDGRNGSREQEQRVLELKTGINYGFVSDSKPYNIYRIQNLQRDTRLTITMTNLKADANIVIGRDFDGQVSSTGLVDFNTEAIQVSDLPGTNPEKLNVVIRDPQFYTEIKVYQAQKGQNTPYRLNIQTTPITPIITPPELINKPIIPTNNFDLVNLPVVSGTLSPQKPIDLYPINLVANGNFSLELQAENNTKLQLIENKIGNNPNLNNIINDSELIDVATVNATGSAVIQNRLINRPYLIPNQYFVGVQSGGGISNYNLQFKFLGSVPFRSAP